MAYNRANELTAGHFAAAVAKALLGQCEEVTAVGTTAADGYVMRSHVVDITGGSSKVIVLPIPAGNMNEVYFVRNSSGNNNSVYPPSGYTINDTTSVSFATAKSAVIVYKQGTTKFFTIPVVPS